jgi:hypothetical protein
LLQILAKSSHVRSSLWLHHKIIQKKKKNHQIFDLKKHDLTQKEKKKEGKKKRSFFDLEKHDLTPIK